MVGAVQELIPDNCIFVSPVSLSKETALQRLVDLLGNSGTVTDTDLFYQEIIEREKQVPTGLGNSCAIPHAHSSVVTKSAIAVAILGEGAGIDFGAPDGIPVRLVFLMAGPKNEASHHLKILAKIARLLHDRNFVDELVSVQNETEFRRLLEEKEGRESV